MKRLQFCQGLLATLLCAVSTGLARSQTAPKAGIAVTVATAARLRMLSQRSTKAYLMLGQGIAVDEARLILQASVEQFELHLASLKTSPPLPDIAEAMAKIEAVWAPCKALLVSPPSPTGADTLYDVSETLQQAAHRLTLAFEHTSDAPIDHLISIAGRQRMLSQRMAKFYFYRTWGLYDAPADMELHLSRAHFTAVLTQVERSPLATGATKDAVASIRREWEPYQQALFATNQPAKMRQNAPRVAQGSERVLVVTEDLLAQLVEQARSESR